MFDKRVIGSFFFMLLVLSLFSTIVSAQTDSIDALKNVGNTILNVLEPLIETLLGSVKVDPQSIGEAGLTSGDLLFARLILLIVILSIVWISLSTLPALTGKKGVLWVLSIAVSLLSVRFIFSPQLVATIILPYSALGVVVTAFFPLLIYFLFVQNALVGWRTLRKVAWILAAVVFFGLYFVRFQELGEYAWLYLISAVACLVVLLLDKSIQSAFRKSKYENMLSLQDSKTRMKIMRNIEELEEARLRGMSDADYNTQKAHLITLANKYNIPYE